MRLTGRRVLVVGGGGESLAGSEGLAGNGQAAAILAAREQAAVVVADIDAAAAAETVGQIERGGGTAAAVIGDVGDAVACERIVSEASEALAGLDGVVLNVGIAAGAGLDGTTAEIWDNVMAVNLRAHFLIAKHALALMESGSLVFVSSVAGFRAGSMSPSYDSSKAGLAGLCRHVAMEGSRRGIRANIVAPGLIDTPLGRRASAQRPSRETTRIPLGRQGTAWEVAEAIVFLLCDQASYITSQSLLVDGGLGA